MEDFNVFKKERDGVCGARSVFASGFLTWSWNIMRRLVGLDEAISRSLSKSTDISVLYTLALAKEIHALNS